MPAIEASRMTPRGTPMPMEAEVVILGMMLVGIEQSPWAQSRGFQRQNQWWNSGRKASMVVRDRKAVPVSHEF